MASIIDRIKSDLLEAINASQRKTSAYDTEAEVVRIEGNTAWVHIAGGVPETPVQLTINAQKGDKIQVRVSNEGAWIMGNATAPPTDDTKAEEAKQEIADTNVIVKAVKTIADRAVKIAGNTNQYFWHTQEGTDTGAHITEIPQEEFLADPSNGGGNLLARSNGIAARDGLDELAAFGANGSQIGINGQSHLKLDYHSMQAIDKEGDYYFYVSDLRNADGVAEMSETMSSVYSSSTTITCYTTLIAYDWENEMEVYADGVLLTPVTGYTYDPTPNMREVSIYRSEYPDVTRDSTIVVNYKTIDQQAKAYTIGLRDDTDTTGVMSTAMGLNTVASGYCSLAWGKGSKAFGKYSCALGERCKAWKMGSYAEGCATEAGYTAHAEGVNTRATGMYSHAQGSQSKATGQCAHAEGEYTQATGPRAHAEGCHTLASDADSHAGGWYSEASGDSAFAHGSYANAQGDQASAFGSYTLASSSNQFVIGKYNVEDTSSTYAFIIGKGTGTSARSNAMQVDWNGKTTIASTLVQNSDRRLKDHISYLGEDAVDFIRQLKPVHYRKDDADHVGFYAQDVESADKWNCMVGEMNGFKTLGYTELIAPLVAYCQSLEKRIEELEGK